MHHTRECGPVRIFISFLATLSCILIRWLGRLCITIYGVLIFSMIKMALYLEEMWSSFEGMQSCRGFQVPWCSLSSILSVIA